MSRLDDLGFERELLLVQAGILRAESGALQAQEKTLTRERNELLQKAYALGYVNSIVEPRVSSGAPESPSRIPTTAKSFGVPADLAGSDSLRRKVEDLQRQLAKLLENRARQTNAEKFFRRANRLLRRQRAALRKENAQLEQSACGTRVPKADAAEHARRRRCRTCELELEGRDSRGKKPREKPGGQPSAQDEHKDPGTEQRRGSNDRRDTGTDRRPT